MKRIVILGAGFGGVYTTLYLLKQMHRQEKIEILLLSKTNYFLFAPLLHEVATGGINRSNIVQPIREIIQHPNFKFLRCSAKEIDFNKRIITTEKTQIPYDYLVIAIGAENEFFNIPGAQEYALPLKSLQDAVIIRNHVLDCLEMSSALLQVKKDEPNLVFVIVGGGPTGVELVGELAEFIDQNLRHNFPHMKDYERKIFLIQRGPEILPFMSNRSRQQALKKLAKEKVIVMTNAAVTKVTKEGVQINHKEMIITKTVIWASGIKPTTIVTNPKVTNEKGYFVADQQLRVQGQEAVYSVGDCAFVINPYNRKQTPALAQVAVRQARIAARNILHELRNEPQETFTFKLSGILVSVGKRFAVADIHGIKFKGFVAWWLWRTIYLSKLVGWRNKLQVAYDWTLNLFFPRDTTQI